MKKLLIALMLLSGVSYADSTDVHGSSAIVLANGTGYLPASSIDKVVIGMATSGGVLEIYNSTFTTSGILISSVSLATVGQREFGNTLVKGIFWRTSSNTNGVTIIYKR